MRRKGLVVSAAEIFTTFVLLFVIGWAGYHLAEQKVEREVVRDTTVIENTEVRTDTVHITPRIEFIETINFESGPVMIVEDSTGEGYVCYP